MVYIIKYEEQTTHRIYVATKDYALLYCAKEINAPGCFAIICFLMSVKIPLENIKSKLKHFFVVLLKKTKLSFYNSNALV